ncbi:MAG: YitT family protein [Bacteroidota bacterium]|nr:YitT family protein [Bacteroidota bacterium]
MNPLFQTLIHQSVLNRKKNDGEPKYRANRKEALLSKVRMRRQLTNIFLILLGILSAGFGLKGFLLPNGFIDGGVTGISLLISKLTGFSLPLLIVVINIPFIFLGYKNIDKFFATKTLLAIIGLSLCLVFVSYPIITSDKLLVAIFGGFFLGAGIGMTMRGGGVIDGTEVLALTVSRNASVTIGDVILIINIIIFSVAAFVLSIETALYSILTYFAASKTLDFIVSGIEEHTGVTIISSCSEQIRRMITEKLGRGVTIYQGKRGYGAHGHQLNETDIVFTVISRLEVSKLNSEIEKIDPKAFVIMSSIKDTKGGMIKKKPLH